MTKKFSHKIQESKEKKKRNAAMGKKVKEKKKERNPEKKAHLKNSISILFILVNEK